MSDRLRFAIVAGCVLVSALFAPTAKAVLVQCTAGPYGGDLRHPSTAARATVDGDARVEELDRAAVATRAAAASEAFVLGLDPLSLAKAPE